MPSVSPFDYRLIGEDFVSATPILPKSFFHLSERVHCRYIFFAPYFLYAVISNLRNFHKRLSFWTFFENLHCNVLPFTCCHQQEVPVTSTEKGLHRTADIRTDYYTFSFCDQIAIIPIPGMICIATRHASLGFLKAIPANPVFIYFYYTDNHPCAGMTPPMIRQTSSCSCTCSSSPVVPVCRYFKSISTNHLPLVRKADGRKK